MGLSRRKMMSVTGVALLTAGCTTTASTPRLTLSATVTSPPTEPFTLDVETLTSKITDGTPGTLAVTYKNTGNQEMTLRQIPAEPHPQSSDDEAPGVVLYDPGASVENAENGSWMPAVDSVSSTLGEPEFELAAGEAVTTEYQLWAHPQGKPEYTNLRPGTYRIPMPESAALQIVLSEP